MKRFAVLSISLLAACGGKPVPADGYADIKYGMSMSELTKLGYKCELGPGGYCINTKPPAKPDDEAGFTTPEGVLVVMVKERAIQVDITFPAATEDETIAAYTRAYGRPEVCRRTLPNGTRDARYVWSAANGAAIVVWKTAVPGATGAAAKGSWASYFSPQVSKEMQVDRC